MHITKIRLKGLSTVDFPIDDALPSDLYILKGADGLGPPEVDVSISNTLNAGGVYQGRRPQNREIVLLVGLNPDYKIGQTAADLRETLYGTLTPGENDYVVVEFVNGISVLASTIGYVKRLEIVPFSKDPQVQITIPCLKPYLEAPELLYVEPGSKSVPAINNVGSAPTGFYMEIAFTTNRTSWTLTAGNGKKMQFDYAFLSGDQLLFDTNPGSRGIWLIRNAVKMTLLDALSIDSTWHMLHGGSNSFQTSSSSFDWGDVYYRPLYQGI